MGSLYLWLVRHSWKHPIILTILLIFQTWSNIGRACADVNQWWPNMKPKCEMLAGQFTFRLRCSHQNTCCLCSCSSPFQYGKSSGLTHYQRIPPLKEETNPKKKARNCSNQKNWNSKKSILTARRCLTIQRRLWPHQGLVGLEVGRLGMEGTLGRPADRWKPSKMLWRNCVKRICFFSRCCQPWDKGNLSNSTPDFMYLSKYIYIYIIIYIYIYIWIRI